MKLWPFRSRECPRDALLQAKLSAILNAQEAIMATLADLQAAVAKIGADVTAAIADIKALQAAPAGINPADLDPIVAALTTASTSLEAVLPPPAPAP